MFEVCNAVCGMAIKGFEGQCEDHKDDILFNWQPVDVKKDVSDFPTNIFLCCRVGLPAASGRIG